MRNPALTVLLGLFAIAMLTGAASASEGGTDTTGIAVGRHRCKFVEDGYKYNRKCKVTQGADGALIVKAPGTELNPGVGFDATLTGTAPGYDVKAKMKTFATCRGTHTGTATVKSLSGKDWYIFKFAKGCQIWIKAESY